MMTRWRRWGSPKARASTTRYAQVYPRSSRASVMCRMAAPLPSCSMNGTFSINSQRGPFLRLTRRNTSSTRPERAPVMPAVLPA
ncbi:Uncharacterised protein [Mycobacteroides abscessus subsp. abscessus]|nr:Uncharacterised protein [Mycobacteroides abscessus subsp. abscessus]